MKRTSLNWKYSTQNCRKSNTLCKFLSKLSVFASVSVYISQAVIRRAAPKKWLLLRRYPFPSVGYGWFIVCTANALPTRILPWFLFLFLFSWLYYNGYCFYFFPFVFPFIEFFFVNYQLFVCFYFHFVVLALIDLNANIYYYFSFNFTNFFLSIIFNLIPVNEIKRERFLEMMSFQFDYKTNI